MPPDIKVLVVDDEVGDPESPHHQSFIRLYKNIGCEFSFATARDGAQFTTDAALSAIEALAKCDLVLLDLVFGEQEPPLGLSVMKVLSQRFPSLPILVFSSLDRDVRLLGRCLEDGALGFVEKAASPKELEASIRQAIEMARSFVLVGQSAALRELRRQAARLSPYDRIPVLIVGERGTGKERVARYIHHNGPRRNAPFTAVNCAAIPEALMEGEFFGAEQGAYTGATAKRIGLFERASGGVLFLDEIGNTPLSLQAKLLRVLQDGRFRRVGSSEQEMVADIQLICATNVHPTELLAQGKLREDLFDRVAAVIVETPPLKACLEDVPELLVHFLRQLGVDQKKRIHDDVLAVLSRYSWPGNVRQLQRCIQEALVRSEDDSVIQTRHLPKWLSSGVGIRGAGVIAKTSTNEESESSSWSKRRLLSEVELALSVKRHVQEYKGQYWKAEFMRLLYPHCKAANAKGFDDLVRRLTQGPWGDPAYEEDRELRRLVAELRS